MKLTYYIVDLVVGIQMSSPKLICYMYACLNFLFFIYLNQLNKCHIRQGDIYVRD